MTILAKRKTRVILLSLYFNRFVREIQAQCSFLYLYFMPHFTQLQEHFYFAVLYPCIVNSSCASIKVWLRQRNQKKKKTNIYITIQGNNKFAGTQLMFCRKNRSMMMMNFPRRLYVLTYSVLGHAL